MGNQADGLRTRIAAESAAALDARPIVRRSIVSGLPVAAGVCFALMGSLGDWGRRAWLLGGIVALAAQAAVLELLAWWRRRTSAADITEANRFRIAMKDALQPLTETVASMPSESKGQRRATLETVAAQTVAALVLLLKNVDRLRAVVFRLDDEQTSMAPMTYFGRGSAPSTFTLGGKRGDQAISLVRERKSLFVPDLQSQKPEDWEGSGGDYGTFISASIFAGERAYGMLTVDAPHADDLGDNDVYLVLVLADLLAIAFAEADRP